MVKRIEEREMLGSTSAADNLRQEAAKGVGTPLERRLADAILENAQNMKAYSKAIEGLMRKSEEALAKGKDSCDLAKHALHEASRALDRAETLTWACVGAVEEGSKKAVSETMETLVGEARSSIEETASEAKGSIGASKRSAELWRDYANKRGWLYQLTTSMKIVVIAAVLGCALVTAWAGWRALPLVRGDVQIVYTEEYQTELDELRAEVSDLRQQLDEQNNEKRSS